MNIVGIRFNETSKTYYFDANGLDLKENLKVIVETDKGLQFGEVVCTCVDYDNASLKNVIRIATNNDIKKHEKNLADAASALIKCNELIDKYSLDMKIIDANYTFNREQLIFRFLSDNRVDFRNLAKELGAIYKTRIELRQIGIRDKAKEFGGIGPCGRKLCCSNFLKEFDSVSINMAKNQNLSLNPTKINGVCGRLLCCLKYENDMYKECKKGLPEIGSLVKNDNINGKVISVDILNRSYKVLNEDNEIILVELSDDSQK